VSVAVVAPRDLVVVPRGSPTRKDGCKNGGWQTFDFPRSFKNQGDCVPFVETGKQQFTRHITADSSLTLRPARVHGVGGDKSPATYGCRAGLIAVDVCEAEGNEPRRCPCAHVSLVVVAVRDDRTAGIKRHAYLLLLIQRVGGELLSAARKPR